MNPIIAIQCCAGAFQNEGGLESKDLPEAVDALRRLATECPLVGRSAKTFWFSRFRVKRAL